MPANDWALTIELPDNFHVSPSANLMQYDGTISKFDYSE